MPAAGFTTVSATALQDSTNTTITNATIYFQPCNNVGAALSFRAGNSGQVIDQSVSAQVVNGAFSIVLADTTLSQPVHVAYAVSVVDNASGKQLLGPGYIIQPSGSAWNFDAFIPILPSPLVTLQAGPQGESAYQVAVDNGFLGTEAQWLTSLIGNSGPAPNVLFDSFNSYTQTYPTLGGWTWYPQGAPTFSTSSTNIPLTSAVAQIGVGLIFFKRWDFSKLGLAIGDTTTASALAYFATSAGGRITIHFYNATGVDIGGSVVSAASNVLGLQTISVAAIVPASTAMVSISVQDTEGTNAFEVGGIFAAKGTGLPSLTKLGDPLSYVRSYLDNSAYGGLPVMSSQAASAINTLAPFGKNIVNANDPGVLTGFFILSTTGVPSANAIYMSTGYVPITAGGTYTRSYSHQMAYFDANLNYISGRAATANVALPETFTVPSGVVYARFTVLATSWATFQVEAGSSATGFQAYARTIAGSQIPQVQTSGIADGAVTLPKTAFSATGKNKFNVNAPDVTLGNFVNPANGQVVVNATYNSTGFVALLPNTAYTQSYSHDCAFYDVNKVYISGLNPATIVTQPRTFTTPPNAFFMRCTVIVASWATYQIELGSSATTWAAYYIAIDPAALPPGGASNAAQVNAFLTDTGAPFLNPYKPELLRQTHYKLMKLGYLPTPEATQLIINLIGDSYTQLTIRWSGPFASYMFAKFGDAGGGWCGFGFNPGGTINTPPWTIGNQPSYIGGNIRGTYPTVLLGNITGLYNAAPSPSLATSTLSASGDAVTVGMPATPVHNGCDLLFVGTSDGVIRYSWDGGTTWTTVNTQGTVGAVQTAALTVGLPSGAGTLQIQWVAGTVTLCGVNLQSAASGVRINNLAGTGSNISQWAGAAAGSLEAGWAALAPHLFIQMDGTNSQAVYTATQWSGYLSALIGRMRAGVPGVDILIATPPENQLGRSIPMSSYALAARDLALAQRLAFIDMQDAFGSATNPTEYGSSGVVPLYASDNTHPDPLTGGRALVFQFLKALVL